MEEGQSIQPPSFPLSSHPLCLQISVIFTARFHRVSVVTVSTSSLSTHSSAREI